MGSSVGPRLISASVVLFDGVYARWAVRMYEKVGGMSSIEIGKFRWCRSEEQRAFNLVPSLYDVDNACAFARESRDMFIEFVVEY